MVSIKQTEIKETTIKKEGITCLPSDLQRSILDFIEHLELYGLFIVNVGELENWVSYLKVEDRKGNWVAKVFEKMGSDPKDKDYVHPGTDDVWAFFDRISKWVGLPPFYDPVLARHFPFVRS